MPNPERGRGEGRCTGTGSGWRGRACTFSEPGREEAFREHFVERHLNLMQAFLLGGAILSTVSMFWYEAIDPVHAPEAPLDQVACSAAPSRPAGRAAAAVACGATPSCWSSCRRGGAVDRFVFHLAGPRRRCGVQLPIPPCRPCCSSSSSCGHATSTSSLVAAVLRGDLCHRPPPLARACAAPVRDQRPFRRSPGLSILWAAYWQERLYRRQFDTMQALEAARDRRGAGEPGQDAFSRFRQPRPAAAHPCPRPERLRPEEPDPLSRAEGGRSRNRARRRRHAADVPFAARPVEIGCRARQARAGVAFDERTDAGAGIDVRRGRPAARGSTCVCVPAPGA